MDMYEDDCIFSGRDEKPVFGKQGNIDGNDKPNNTVVYIVGNKGICTNSTHTLS